MWFATEVIFPRIIRSFFWVVIIQAIYISFLFLLMKSISWNPFTGIIDWLFYLIHWKTLLYQVILCLSTVLFGVLNMQYYSVQKHIPTTRFQKICHILSPRYLQHFIVTSGLGVVVSFCFVGLSHSFDPEKTSILGSCLQVETEFEYFFVIQHGCFSGFMFSLKYFVCCLYLLKFSLEQKTKLQFIQNQAFELLKDSASCILKSLLWNYLLFFMISSFLPSYIFIFSKQHFSSVENILYSLFSFKLFLASVMSGIVIFFNWSLYILIFNTCAVEPYCFNIDMPTKNKNNKCLSTAIQSSETDILKYLAVMDLRLLAQHNLKRRLQIFDISHPGGHPYQWNSISEECELSLKVLLEKLHTYAVNVAAKESKPEHIASLEQTYAKQYGTKPLTNVNKKVFPCFQRWPTVICSYFFDELPNTKIKQIFSSSQYLVWMIEALGYLLTASYVEDKYGVVQLMLPKLVCLLLDLKMAEEKLPIDPIGIERHVRDPQDRYEHIHQRLALKTAVNSSLSRIATVFKDDVKGIYLPDEYDRYFQRFLDRKNI
ncbi:nucleoporin NDC1 isoform X2 [Parasteatoda tepidariorum]|uniref:nucleoporin NDC1 isoform X2 n=1 Tax=Parasteatoda tepidariorum TaxID=114398 RepID=UPI00077FCDD5|nr:nucleoporin NDC1 isoform X2 [Parasteatoda tepidariorum]